MKIYKPTSPALRYRIGHSFQDLTRNVSPLRSLLRHQKKTGGRNCFGRITSRFRGGGHKQRYRVIDFKRQKIGVVALVKSIEYDPNRTARIALLSYMDGCKSYIVAPTHLCVGDSILSSCYADVKPGNSMPLSHIPLGTSVHSVELKKGKGGQLVRSAGTCATLIAKDNVFAQVKLPSGEIRRVHLCCRATIGRVSNVDHINVSSGKAGRSRWLGRRPHNRGVSMNPVDHPMGGGEGRTSGGRHPCSPFGVLSKGFKTRTNKRTNSMIVSKKNKK